MVDRLLLADTAGPWREQGRAAEELRGEDGGLSFQQLAARFGPVLRPGRPGTQ